jgi:hypothetical protein
MIGLKRLDNLQFCTEDALAHRVPGDVIETGVWRGGATILMRGILKAYGITDRVMWVARASTDSTVFRSEGTLLTSEERGHF